MASTAALLYVFKEKYDCKPGIITVMHTFGGDIKWNPHVHCIVTHGGLSYDVSSWNFHEFIPYSMLMESWRYHVVTELREWGKQNMNKEELRNFDKNLNNLYLKNVVCECGKGSRIVRIHHSIYWSLYQKASNSRNQAG